MLKLSTAGKSLDCESEEDSKRHFWVKLKMFLNDKRQDAGENRAFFFQLVQGKLVLNLSKWLFDHYVAEAFNTCFSLSKFPRSLSGNSN